MRLRGSIGGEGLVPLIDEVAGGGSRCSVLRAGGRLASW